MADVAAECCAGMLCFRKSKPVALPEPGRNVKIYGGPWSGGGKLFTRRIEPKPAGESLEAMQQRIEDDACKHEVRPPA